MSAIVAKDKVFLEMDRRDQQQIVLSYMGESVDDLFYEVEGRKGLSWQGVNTICYMMGDIKVEPWVQWENIEMHGQEYWSVTVRAVNEKYNLASLGTAEAPLMKKVYDRDENRNRIPDGEGGFIAHLEPDQHCRRVALSKAQRNAKRAVIPEPLLIKWLEYFIAYVNFTKGKISEKPEPPIKSKVVDANYHVIPRSPPEKKERTSGKKKGKSDARKLTMGKVSEDVIKFNLRALGFTDDDLGVFEKEKGFIVEPARDLTDGEYYKVNSTLEGMGGVWEDVGYSGQWKIQRRDER